MTTTTLAEVLSRCAETGTKIGELYESMIEEFYKGFLVPGDSAIDGGAHTGRHTLEMSRAVGHDGTIYAFEPAPWTMDALVKRVAVEKASNIQLLQFALSDRFALSDFHYFPSARAMSGLKRRADLKEAEAQVVPVPTAPLDQLPQIRGRIRFIKLDLEGGEFHALKGAAGVMHRCRPVVHFEFGRQSSARVYGYTRDDFFEYFQGLNYRLLDAFGAPFNEDGWRQNPYHFQFVAYPAEASHIEGMVSEAAHRVLTGVVPQVQADQSPISQISKTSSPSRPDGSMPPETAAQIFKSDFPRLLKTHDWNVVADARFARSAFLSDIDPARITLLSDDVIPSVDDIHSGQAYVVCVSRFEGLTVRHLRARQKRVAGLLGDLAMRHVARSPFEDFVSEPEPVPADRRFAILSLPRSASTVLAHELSAIGFGAPFEHIQDQLTVVARARAVTGFSFSRWRDLLEHHASVDGLFVTKIIWDLFGAFQAELTAEEATDLEDFLRFDGIIRIIRHNKVDQAVSDYLAHKTKIWHLWPQAAEGYEAKLTSALDTVDYDDLETRYRHLTEQEAHLDAFMRSYDGDVVQLDFDDISQDPAAAAQTVARRFDHKVRKRFERKTTLRPTRSDAHAKLAEALRLRIGSA